MTLAVPHVYAEDLEQVFPGRAPLFGGLDLRLAGGDLVALIGPSGSGKTTLLTLLAGWLRPSHGSVSHDGVVRTAWVAQNPHGTAGRTALDHVVLPLLARGARRRDAEPVAREQLTRFGLAEAADRQFRFLSGGEAGRLMLAVAVATEPDLLLVDEPTAQLDPRSSGDVITALHELAADHRIVVVATHDPRVRDSCRTVVDLGVVT